LYLKTMNMLIKVVNMSKIAYSFLILS
jgi:hypothetical protein